jgi:hypothetical protein
MKEKTEKRREAKVTGDGIQDAWIDLVVSVVEQQHGARSTNIP